MSEFESRECGVMLTIENRLGLYANEKKEERNEVLWYVWQQNKRWLGNILEWILPSFPNYSMHDKSHSLSVLHNIEMLLGESQIKKLSASDCFMILHVVFLHDVGMCITASDRRKLMNNVKFIEFLKEHMDRGSIQTQRYAKLLLKYCNELGVEENPQDVLKVKLEMYYAMIFLTAEYVRKEHASSSREQVEKWMKQSDKMGLGYGFSYSGIPQRLFYMVGACASVHNSSDFNDVMKLPKIDDGFAHDYIHPRFVAVLLQLGDSLDLDNDRFHPLIKEVVGKLPWESEKHYEKHKAIRRLRISPLKLTVAADCDSPEALRQINRECNGIKNILQNAAYHWSAICPDDLDARLPNFEPVELKMNGKVISDKLINAEFNIQQKKAFNFLQGGNFYKDEKFVFLRELFQNAVDASKMQYWIDWNGSRWNEANKKNGKTVQYSLSEMGKRLSPCAYPIVIELHLARKMKQTGKITLLDRIECVNDDIAKKGEAEYGVFVWVIDYGIGMSEEDISAIADVGTSYERNEKRREGMPSWLLPTAEFGIGLQSVFLITDSFTAYTHTRSGEKYKLEFHATGDKGSGHIHVTPLDEKIMLQYGTKVEVFVPCAEKKKHQQELKTWCGKDPFSENYADYRPFRHAKELAVQLAISLDSMIGERIFPIELRLYDYANSENRIYRHLLSNEIKNLNYKIILNDKVCDEKDTKAKKISLEASEEYVAWPIYRSKDTESIIRGQIEQVSYMFDCEHMKLYLCDHEHHDVYARFGADRLLDIWQQVRKYVQDEEERGTKIFYKGIYVERKEWKRDANLLEYIDIKEKIERKYLRINRCEFTSEGQLYLEEQIYPHILNAARKVLLHCECKKVIQKIKEKLNKLQGEMKIELQDERKAAVQENRIYNVILSVVGLAVFAQIRNRDSWESIKDKENAREWNQILKLISDICEGGKEKGLKWADSSMFKIAVFDSYNQGVKPFRYVNIAHVMDCHNKYAIMSVRKSVRRSWKEFLISLNPNETEDEKIEGATDNSARFSYIMKEYMQLEKERTWEKRKEILDKTEEEGDILLGYCSKIAKEDSQNDIETGKWDKILKWILYNMPSTEIFFSKDSNLRINVLGLEYSDTIYLNRYMRYGIWEKMKIIYQERKIERFSTIVPCGYSALEIHDKEKSIYYVKRGFFLYMERPYVINPFVGEILEFVFSHLNDSDSELNLLKEIYRQQGIKNGVNNQEELVVEQQLLDYIRERSNVKMTDEEYLNLYQEYLREWLYLLRKCTESEK